MNPEQFLKALDEHLADMKQQEFDNEDFSHGYENAVNEVSRLVSTVRSMFSLNKATAFPDTKPGK